MAKLSGVANCFILRRPSAHAEDANSQKQTITQDTMKSCSGGGGRGYEREHVRDGMRESGREREGYTDHTE